MTTSQHATGLRYTAAKRRQVEAARQARIAAEMAEQAAWTLEQHIAYVPQIMAVTAGVVTVNGIQVSVEDFARDRMDTLRQGA
jgi:hypothetical protein